MGVPKRFIFTVLGAVSFFHIYAMRVNLSVSIDKFAPHFKYNDFEKGLVLSAFFYGYITSQLLGGFIAAKGHGVRVFALGLLSTSVLTVLTPLAAPNLPLMVALRIVEGMGEGVTFPAMHMLLGRWTPSKERTILSSVVYSSCYMGTVIAQPVTGWLCESSFLGGWPASFYVFGVTGTVTALLFIWLVYESPDVHPGMSEHERAYIKSSGMYEDLRGGGSSHSRNLITQSLLRKPLLSDKEAPSGPLEADGETEEYPLLPSKDNDSVPWKAIFSSRCVWGLILAHTCHNYGLYTLLTCLPTYLYDVLGKDLGTTGLLASLPYLMMYISGVMAGFVSDYLRVRWSVSTTVVRKLFNSVAMFGVAACLTVCGWLESECTIVTFLSVAGFCSGFTQSGYANNHIDLSMRYTGVLMGISNSCSSIPGIVGPQIASILTPSPGGLSIHSSMPKWWVDKIRSEWRTVFIITASILVFGGFVFILFGSGERQPWDKPSSSPRREQEDGISKRVPGEAAAAEDGTAP